MPCTKLFGPSTQHRPLHDPYTFAVSSQGFKVCHFVGRCLGLCRCIWHCNLHQCGGRSQSKRRCVVFYARSAALLRMGRLGVFRSHAISHAVSALQRPSTLLGRAGRYFAAYSQLGPARHDAHCGHPLEFFSHVVAFSLAGRCGHGGCGPRAHTRVAQAIGSLDPAHHHHWSGAQCRRRCHCFAKRTPHGLSSGRLCRC